MNLAMLPIIPDESMRQPERDDSIPDSIEGVDSDMRAVDPVATIVPTTIVCWRCERVEQPVAGKCPACKAQVTDIQPSTKADNHTQTVNNGHGSTDLTFVLGVYSILLLTSMMWGWVLFAQDGHLTNDDVRVGTIALEIFDTFLVLICLSNVGSCSGLKLHLTTRVITWLLAVPTLFMLIGLGSLYCAILRDFINANGFLDTSDTELTTLTVLYICVQPAIVEELFFRYVAFGVLSRITGLRTTIWVTSVMFAMAHIYNPLGMPYLFVAGLVFGLARLRGGIALSMIMHFLHNLTVIGLEAAR
jgi:uncharacterized protein